MIRKNNITVTMPIREYEDMQNEIKELKGKQISNYTNYIFPKDATEEKDVSIELDQEKLIKDIAAANPRIKTINVHTRTGLLINPIKINGDTDV